MVVWSSVPVFRDKGISLGKVFSIWTDGIDYVHLTGCQSLKVAVTNYHLAITVVKPSQCLHRFILFWCVDNSATKK